MIVGPVIRKAAEIRGTRLSLRDATIQDAAFIHNLRADPSKSQNLSVASKCLEDQVEWLRKYSYCHDQAYFIICNHHNTSLGCIRMYRPIGKTFEWGSWLMVNGQDPTFAIESVVLLYAYANLLGFDSARFNVNKSNVPVANFHQKIFGAVKVSETAIEVSFQLEQKNIQAALKKYSMFITKPLQVIPISDIPML